VVHNDDFGTEHLDGLASHRVALLSGPDRTETRHPNGYRPTDVVLPVHERTKVLSWTDLALGWDRRTCPRDHKPGRRDDNIEADE